MKQTICVPVDGETNILWGFIRKTLHESESCLKEHGFSDDTIRRNITFKTAVLDLGPVVEPDD